MAYEQYWFAGDGMPFGGWTKAGQSFTTSNAYTLGKVWLPLQEGLYTTGNAHIYLYAVDEEHYPTGSPLLTIGAITAEELTGDIQWIEFSGLNYDMLATTEYAIVVEIDNYEETYANQEDIPQIRWLCKDGYDGKASEQDWYLDEESEPNLWRHTTVYAVVPAAGEFGFITEAFPYTSIKGTIIANATLITPFPYIFMEGNIIANATLTKSIPAKPVNPAPADAASDIGLSYNTLTWESGT